MKRVILFVILFLLSTGTTSAAEIPEQEMIEEITKFDSGIIINKDTSISITEKIDYFTPEEKHGIFRYIPEKYRKEGLIDSHPISDISVTDEKYLPLQYSLIKENGNVAIKIGDPDITFLGKKTYIVSYTVKNAVLRHDGYDELYWDITGEGWQFPIRASQVTIASPHAKTNGFRCFTGPVGGTESNCSGNTTTNVFIFTDTPINYGDNFTIAVKLDPAGELVFPGKTENQWSVFANNYPFLLLLLPGLLMFLYWYRRGRDFRFVSQNVFDSEPNQPQGLRPLFEPINIPMVYEPLKDLTPGEAGIMLDERVDNQDVVAEIIDLARKKYLKIERVKKTGFLQFGDDYLFTKLKESSDRLPSQQDYLMKNIFESKSEVKMSELKGTFYIHMAKVKEMMSKDLSERKMFTSKPETAIMKGAALAIGSCIAVFALSINAISFLGAAWPVGIMFASFITSLIFILKMPQKTALGTNLSLQAKGLKETIRLGKWREEIKEKHLFIEEVLPYAISLGVIGKLAADMANLNITPPKYMSGGFNGNAIAWSGFMSDFSQSASSGLSYNPSSSSSGGSGSSGGGGGGGGGGSW